jgi:hypothetical protein
MYILNEHKRYLYPCFNGLSFIRNMFQTPGATSYIVKWDTHIPIMDVSSVKIHNKHNLSIYQPIITTLVSLPMTSGCSFYLHVSRESQSSYLWPILMYSYRKVQQIFYQKWANDYGSEGLVKAICLNIYYMSLRMFSISCDTCACCAYPYHLIPDFSESPKLIHDF